MFRLIIFQVRPDFRKLGDKIIFLNGSNGICGVLASQLQQTPTKAIMTSVSKERTLYEIRQRFNAGSFYAERLTRTQTNHFENETEFIAYQEIGIDKYCPPTPLVLSPNRAWVKHELQLVNQRCAIQS